MRKLIPLLFVLVSTTALADADPFPAPMTRPHDERVYVSSIREATAKGIVAVVGRDETLPPDVRVVVVNTSNGLAVETQVSATGSFAAFVPAAISDKLEIYGRRYVNGKPEDGPALARFVPVAKGATPPLQEEDPEGNRAIVAIQTDDTELEVTGSPGTAKPEHVVLVGNVATGHVVAVSPASDGSFTSNIFGKMGSMLVVVSTDPTVPANDDASTSESILVTAQ